mmetsp:Transcript_16273/g.24324  ORF Transcript_16273/g.24324 Transcript_16273/m.24324 type:complete len:739 (-) Transcript_16273:284-2500(-)
MLTKSSYLLIVLVASTASTPCTAFHSSSLLCSPSIINIHKKRFTSACSSQKNERNDFRNDQDIAKLRSKATNLAIIEQLLTGSTGQEDSSALVQLQLVGTGDIGPASSLTKCLFLAKKRESYQFDSSPSYESERQYEYSQSLPIPLPYSRANSIIKLLSFAYRGEPISKSLCLTLNPLLVNRDGALFDSLPYSQWTIDPLMKNRDASQNPIDEKFHLGKRDAYNRFFGRDWYGRSLSIGNLAARAKYMLEGEETANRKEEEVVSLAQRVLELEVKEARMAVAEAEEQSAILRVELGGCDLDEISDDELLANYDALESGLQAVQDAKQALEETEDALSSMMKAGSGSNDSFASGFLSAITEGYKSNAPYRGAQGYTPTIDSKEEMLQKSILPYSSPFEMMKEIIDEQLNAEVIGCIIEDSSLFSGSTIFGGGIIIKRKGREKKLRLNGEEVSFTDSDDDFGNNGIKQGEAMIVECDVDEAIGMALACDVDVVMASSEWDRSKISVSTVFQESGDDDNSVMDAVPNLTSSVESIKIEMQGNGKMSENTKIQAPRDANEFSIFGSPSNSQQPVFDTNIPVQSLGEFDTLTVQDKAQLLLSLDSFKGRLPRPRTLKSGSSEKLDPLDELLLPLIDESVRRQVLIRSAEERGDTDELNVLELEKSRKQMAKENAVLAREEGKDELAAMWDKEAYFYSTLRADATQDEGSYSRFLDRDDWYERTRQRISKKNKNKFGTLLDGLE